MVAMGYCASHVAEMVLPRFTVSVGFLSVKVHAWNTRQEHGTTADPW
jgi:hypothetical protein